MAVVHLIVSCPLVLKHHRRGKWHCDVRQSIAVVLSVLTCFFARA